MMKALRIISKTLSSLLIAAVVLLAVLLGGVRLFGLTPYTVLSGSMEPTYHVGSVIYVAKVSPADLREGDPVTYRLPAGTVVTHRIERVQGESAQALSFITKGDANQVADSAVPASAVIGKPLFSVPYLGYVSEFVQRPSGLILLGAVCAAVLIFSLAADVLSPKAAQDKPAPQDSEA